jgi:choline kinase
MKWIVVNRFLRGASIFARHGARVQPNNSPISILIGTKERPALDYCALLAVILAAGTSSRLYPLTADTPKALLDVAGRSILDRMLDGLAGAGVGRVVIVTGYRAERIDAHIAAARPRQALEIVTVTNAAYATTNNAASLAAARTAIGAEPFVLCDGDVVFAASPFPALMATPDPSAIVVDRAAALDEEAMKVAVGADGLVTRLSKQLDPKESAGESIGVQKVGGAALPALWNAIDDVVATHAASAYYEDAFQRLIDRGVPFGVTAVAPGSWREVDDAADLAAARAMLAQG